MSAGLVRLQPADAAGVARVTPSNPAKLNALSVAMWRQLREACVACSTAAAHTRAVLIHGEGAHFAAGGDIEEFPDSGVDEERLRQSHEAGEAQASAARIAALAPQAHRIDKRTLRQRAEGGPSAAQRHENSGYADSAEHREGLTAFAERRPAGF